MLHKIKTEKVEKSQFFEKISLASEFKVGQTRLKLRQSPFSTQSLEVDWTVLFEFFMNQTELTQSEDISCP